MPGRPRTGPKRDPEAQRAVLAAAEELLGEIGFHRVTMERIAERSGVGKMTLYRWWPNKAAVITDAVRDKLAPTATPDTGDVTQDVIAQLTELVAVLLRYGDASVVAAAMSSRGEAGRADLRDILDPWLVGLTAILTRGGHDSPLTAQAWLGFVVYRIVFLQEDVTTADLTALVTQALRP